MERNFEITICYVYVLCTESEAVLAIVSMGGVVDGWRRAGADLTAIDTLYY